MRTVICTFDGETTPGDLLILYYRGARGGASAAKCFIPELGDDGKVAPGTTSEKWFLRGFAQAKDLEDVVSVLARDINGMATEWSPGAQDFKAVAKGKRLMLMSSSNIDDATFHFSVDGVGTETCEIEVL